MSDMTIGTPIAMISSAESDSVSTATEQRTPTSIAAINGRTSRRSPAKTACSATPCSLACASAALRVWPSPTNSALAGMPRARSAAIASTSWPWFFSGRNAAKSPTT